MTAVVDVLVRAGARAGDVVVGAAAGDVSRWPLHEVPPEQRVLALIMAADHQRLDVIDRLVAAGTPVDAVDATWGRQALRLAAENGRPRSVESLLAHGADPDLRDQRGRRPLDLCREGATAHPGSLGHDEAEHILEAVTGSSPAVPPWR